MTDKECHSHSNQFWSLWFFPLHISLCVTCRGQLVATQLGLVNLLLFSEKVLHNESCTMESVVIWCNLYMLLQPTRFEKSPSLKTSQPIWYGQCLAPVCKIICCHDHFCGPEESNNALSSEGNRADRPARRPFLLFMKGSMSDYGGLMICCLHFLYP